MHIGRAWAVAVLVVGWLTSGAFGDRLAALAAEAPARQRRVLYNFDGDSCLFTKAGGKGPVEVSADDVRRLVEEVAFDGSQVDTILVCIDAQVMYYPTRVGTMRGAGSTPAEREKWPATEKQRFANIERLFAAGHDPYAILLAEARRRGLEALLTFRVNDAHGNDFLRTQFWVDRPDCRLGAGALDFGKDAARDYVYRLIEEAVRRYDSDGIELDFNRFPKFFAESAPEERVAKMNSLVERVRTLLDTVGAERNRRLTLAVRVPSNFGRTPPTPESCRELGCDVPDWVERGWVDFVVVSEFLFTRYDLPLKPWKERISKVPVYGGIECTEGGQKEQYLTQAKYRRAANHLWQEGANGIYLFNFFTTREFGPESWEPPFAALCDLGDPARCAAPALDLPAELASRRMQLVGGDWRASAEEVVQSDTAGGAFAFFADRPLADAALAFDFNVRDLGNGVRAAGAVLRSRDSESFYGVHFDARNDQVVLYASPWKNLPDWIVLARGAAQIDEGVWHAARIEAQGARLRISLNGATVLQAEDDRYAAGLAGLYTSEGSVAFRDVRLDGTPALLAEPWRNVTPPRRWKTVASGPAAGGYAAFPDLCRDGNGDLLCVFYSGYGHVSTPNEAWPKGGRVLGVRSTDGGATWGEPFVVADTVHDDRDPHIARLKDGTLACNWFVAPHPQHPLPNNRPLGIFLSRSTDDGRSWSEPVEVSIDAADSYACSAPVRELSDGSLVLGLYAENARANRVFGAVIKSRDGGQTWGPPAMIGENSGLYLDAETDVIELKDGKLLAALRSSKTDLYLSTSNDGGVTWSEVRSAGFPGHCPHFLRHSSGAILLSHRLPNTALHWSRDEGQTWQGPLQIDGVIGAYPSCVELAGGPVYCVYYEEGANSGIRGVRLSVTESGVGFPE